MSKTSVTVPFPVFDDRDGQPLENGFVFIGLQNLNPQTNPQAVFFDENLTIPAAQPLRTINGFISNAGTPAQVFVNAVNYSILVQDKNGSLVYSFAKASGVSADSSASDVTFTGFKGQDGFVQDLADDDGADYIGFEQSGVNVVAVSVQDKLRESVSVKDFGALGDGLVDDTAAFIAAGNASPYVIVPKGVYKLDSDVDKPAVIFEFRDASLIGEGLLKSPNILEYDASGVYTSKQSGFVESNGLTKSFAEVATANFGEFPKKYYPIAAYIELLRLSPGVTKFETQDGLTINAMNETYFREVIAQMYENGIQNIVVPYVEYLAFWFYKPSFPYPYDFDTSRFGQFWGDWVTEFPNVQPFDAIRVILEESSKLGMKVWLGLTRNGDTPLLNDLFSVNVLGNPDPMRYGLSLPTRLSLAVNSTQEIAADLIEKYNHFPAFHGFFISHEADHLASANNYYTPTNFTGGVHPSVRSYDKPIMIAPSSPIDLAATSTFANAMILSGADIIMPQDSVGPGYDFTTNVYTFVPSVAIADLASHFSTFQQAITIANAKQALTNRSIRLWSTTETWQMGFVQSTTLTLSAVSGVSITATAGASIFSPSDVGKFITSVDNGNALIISYTSPTIVIISTGVTGGVAFASTSQSANNYSINSQYSNDYPAPFSRIYTQLLEEWPFIEAINLYAWFGFLDSGTLSLRLMQTNSGLTDFRTRATDLYQGYNAFYRGQRDKFATASSTSIIQQQFLSRGSAVAAASFADNFAFFFPRSDTSRVSYICTVRGTLALGTSTLTVNLRINDVNVQSAQDVAISNVAGGTYTFLFTETPKGLTRSVGISFSSTSADFTLSGVEVIATETV